ncbi:hypothetical protein [Gordonia humi]|uniref:Mce-associated membrane protein n=1 Tax=Gordonia humi TaxID=686429 RepID=A0A840F3E3_9ACTN|nr:hypothetical protein [Gordonia humi]MBB4137003.1 Mce-associated membrane protein [Gordonia humi]
MATTPGDEPTSLDGDDFLAANRARREQIRAGEAAKNVEEATNLDEEPAGDDSDATGTGRVGDRGAGRTLVGVLAALVVVLAVTTAVFGYLAFSGTDDDSGDLDRAGALRDAKEYAAQMLTYDTGKYDDLDRRIREISTPAFADRYITSSQEARKGNDAVQASSKGSAETAGIVSITPNEAVVLVALDNTVTSPQAPALGTGDGPYPSRVKLTLTREGGRWLVSDLDVI